MADFVTTTNYAGYKAQKDVLNIEDNVLVGDSQNLLFNDGEKISMRKGYFRQGTIFENSDPSTTNNFDSFPSGSYNRFKWRFPNPVQPGNIDNDNQLPFRTYQGFVQVFVEDRALYVDSYPDQDGGYWGSIFELSVGADPKVRWTTWWDDVNQKEVLIFCQQGNGNTAYSWTGAVASLQTVNVAGQTVDVHNVNWENFLTGANQFVVDINGQLSTFAYTSVVSQGGDDYRFNGVTTVSGGSLADLDAANTVVEELVVANPPVPFNPTGVNAGFDIDFLSTVDNQVYYGSRSSNVVYISKNGLTGSTDYQDVTFTLGGRLPGEGATIFVDGGCRGFAPQDSEMFVSSGTSNWTKVEFVLSSDLTKETVRIKRLRTSSKQAAIDQEVITRTREGIIFLSQAKTLETLQTVEQGETSFAENITYDIQDYLDNADVTHAHLQFDKDTLYLTLPAEGRVLMYNTVRKWWETPQALPIACIETIFDKLYGYDYSKGQSYRLFEGDVDNAFMSPFTERIEFDDIIPIEARATFGYRDYGEPDKNKSYDEVYLDGFITADTKLEINLRHGYNGCGSTRQLVLDSSKDTTACTDGGGTFGKQSFGYTNFGSTILPSTLRFFQGILSAKKDDFTYKQFELYMNTAFGRFEVFKVGFNISLSTTASNELKDKFTDNLSVDC